MTVNTVKNDITSNLSFFNRHKMNEFLKLNWRIENPTEIDQQLCFLPEEIVSESYVYKHFTKPLKPKAKAPVKLNFTKEKYIPGKKYYRQIPKRSLLTKSQKSHCLTALKLLQSGKSPLLMTASEKYSYQVYTECQPKIVEENKNFLQYVQTMWNKNKDRPLKIKPGICNYSWHHWKTRIKRYLDYPKFYKELSMISLNYNENESIINFQQIFNPLEMGTLARFATPNLKEECCLKIVTLPKFEEKSLNSKLSVSQDQNVAKLLETHNFDVVISSSGLKQIIDYTNTKTKWTLPVVIKEITINNTNKKVVFIDKVLPKVNPSYYDLKYYAYKQLLKSNFCQYKAFSYPTEETPIDCDKTTGPENEENCEDKNEDNESDKNKNRNKARYIHHNVSYRIWNIKKTDDQNTLMKNKATNKEINLLIRCKLDACECTDQGVLLPVIIRPKIEQQLQYGANIPSKSELARDWASLFFRIYSNLYRARIFSGLSEVVSVEKCTLQKINSEALTHYDYKPMLGLGVLAKILEQLTNLECGHYLLQHLPKHETFLAIMKECDESVSNYDLHAEIDRSDIDREAKQCWLPIDVNYILPVHEEFNQPPATFRGFDNNPTAVKKKKKNKKKKGKVNQQQKSTVLD